jgi:hypothetical protein
VAGPDAEEARFTRSPPPRDPKNHDQDFAGADVAEKAGEHGAAGIGAGAGPTRQPAMGLWRRHANKARFRFLRGPLYNSTRCLQTVDLGGYYRAVA